MNAARALDRLPSLDAIPPVVETLTAWTRHGPIQSRIYHDHAARVALARAAQRIGGVGNGLDAVSESRLVPHETINRPEANDGR